MIEDEEDTFDEGEKDVISSEMAMHPMQKRKIVSYVLILNYF